MSFLLGSSARVLHTSCLSTHPTAQTQTHACMCVRVHMCARVCAHMCVCARARACARASALLFMGACMHVCMYVHVAQSPISMHNTPTALEPQQRHSAWYAHTCMGKSPTPTHPWNPWNSSQRFHRNDISKRSTDSVDRRIRMLGATCGLTLHACAAHGPLLLGQPDSTNKVTGLSLREVMTGGVRLQPYR